VLPLTRQEKSVLLALAGVILTGSLCQWISKILPVAVQGGSNISFVQPRLKIDINRASSEQLMSIPHIGPARARAIIDFRERQGAFIAVDDIEKVAGIGPKLSLRLKPYMAVEGP